MALTYSAVALGVPASGAEVVSGVSAIALILAVGCTAGVPRESTALGTKRAAAPCVCRRARADLEAVDGRGGLGAAILGISGVEKRSV